MRKNDRFLIKNEFQRPRFGGESFWSQEACPFCGGGWILIYGNRFRAGYAGLTAGFARKLLISWLHFEPAHAIMKNSKVKVPQVFHISLKNQVKIINYCSKICEIYGDIGRGGDKSWILSINTRLKLTHMFFSRSWHIWCFLLLRLLVLGYSVLKIKEVLHRD